MNPLVIIPARLGSTRLPGKPLVDIGGRPMIAHVVDRAQTAAIGPVLVATDDDAIADACRAAGAWAVMTRADHASGTDRIAEALAAADPEGRHDVIVNLQGDEPELDPMALRAVLAALALSGTAIGTLASPLDPADTHNPHAVKMTGRPLAPDRIAATAFFRAAPAAGQAAWRHIGVYAYRRDALERFVALPPSDNERCERLEQLRALDAGMAITATLVEAAPRGIDTPADLAAVRARLAGGASR